MPKHLYPGYKQRTASSTTETGVDESEAEDEEGNSFDLLRHLIIK
jgi:hypothetical protein